MGIGEDNNFTARIIYVGFIKPREDEMARNPEAIYVCLRPWGGSVGVEAFSEEDFVHNGEKIVGTKNLRGEKHRMRASNMTSSPREGFAITSSHYREFIDRLALENKASVRYMLVEDGAKLYEKLEQIQGLAGIVQSR